MFRRSILFLTLVAFATSCYRVPTQIEPLIEAPPHPKEVHRQTRSFLSLPTDFSKTPFLPLTPEEQQSAWGREYQIALGFAEDFDLYRAITGFKRALFFSPPFERCLEIEYSIALAYYLGCKYTETIYTVQSTSLVEVDCTFPAYSDLLLLLYDSYIHIGKREYAGGVFALIEADDAGVAAQLSLLQAIREADFETLSKSPETKRALHGYLSGAKSIRKAQILNATLPGAGYWYVGLRQTAVTALLINSLFIAAGATLITEGHTAAGIFVLSLEGGWYFGGIAGAGLAAKEYNEHLYCNYAQKITSREPIFPLTLLNYTF